MVPQNNIENSDTLFRLRSNRGSSMTPISSRFHDSVGILPSGPTISVIIPTYNRANLLPRVIKSVLSQTFKNIELIIVNDASTDTTDEVIKSFDDKRIVYIKHKENKGPFGAMNTGFDAVRGKYVISLMDDDEFLPGAFKTIIDKFDELSPKGIKVLWFDCIDAETGKYSGSGIRKEGYILYEDILCNKVAGDYFPAIDRLVIGNHRFDQTLWNMPSLFSLKLYRNNKVFYIPKALAKAYRNHKQDRISRPESSFAHIPSILLQEKIFLKEYGSEVKNLCSDFYGKKRASLGMYQILNNEKIEGRRNILESFSFHFSLAHGALFILSFMLTGNQLKYICLSFFNIKERIINLSGEFIK